MIVVFLGPPGAGKGTQAALLSEKTGLPVIAIGYLLREAYRKKTPEGIKAWEHTHRGLNAPTDLKFKILADKMNQTRGGFILDNFPRTKEDLGVFQGYLQEKGLKVDRAFHLVISEKTAIDRMLARRADRVSDNREDDNLETIKVRFENGYQKDLSIILDYFRHLGVLEEIDGGKDLKIVHEEILRRLKPND